MFPITVEEIHAGWIKGKERIITKLPGVYGWHGERDLHIGYHYDGRGTHIPSTFLTTVGPHGRGLRTEIGLGFWVLWVLVGSRDTRLTSWPMTRWKPGGHSDPRSAVTSRAFY